MAQISRRHFLKNASISVGASSILGAQTSHGNPSKSLPILKSDQQIEVHTELNGQPVSFLCSPLTTLAEALRNAGYTGTKTACEAGSCGACSVIVNENLVNSCLTLAFDVENKKIRTIEGLQTSEKLHPLQQAFIDADALQCGFCTPGMLMAATSFYEKWQAQKGNKRPTRDQVTQAMAGNLCRCGAHPNIITAIAAACAQEKAFCAGGPLPGHAIDRADAVEKATGNAKYAFDIVRKNMLHAAILRSPIGHAEILSLDLEAVQKMPGVIAVEVMIPKLQKNNFGKIRWAGQEIAAVAAKTQAQAQAALSAFNLKLEPLNVVTTRDAALKEDAPLVWDTPENHNIPLASEGIPAPDFVFPWHGNQRGPAMWPLSKNNSAALTGVKNSTVECHMTFSTASQVHIPLERHGCVAEHLGNQLTLWATTQTVHILAQDLAEVFALPRTKVRVRSDYVGGGFGCKAGLRPEHLAAARLSLKAKAPVRLFYTWQDQLSVGGNRPETHQKLSLAASKEGLFTHVVHKSENLCGAAVGESSTGLTQSHYTFQEAHITDTSVVTHAAPACPWRAPGHPPNAFALEQAVDDIAVQVNKNPLVLRLEQENRRRARGLYRLMLHRCGYGERLTQTAQNTGRYRRGIGIASGEWFALSAPNCRVQIKASLDGHFEVSTATHDMGQGARTVLKSVVSELLFVPAERIHVLVGDSDLPMAPGSFGSISTSSITPAAQNAVFKLKKELLKAVKKEHSKARLSERGISNVKNRLYSFSEACTFLEENPHVVEGIRGADQHGFKFPPKIFDGLAEHIPLAVGKDTPLSLHAVEVEIDTISGTVIVQKVISAIDAGRIASPKTARSQVIGAIMQGISYALYEERKLCPRTGGILSSSFDHYRILGIADAPEVEVHFYEGESENTPFGSIGLGENSIVAVAAAVANAIFRAIGKRILTTPMTPTKILTALQSTTEIIK